MKPVTVEKSKRLIENRFYRDENLTSENIVKAFNLAGWQETRDWIGRDDDLTFIKGPSRISFSIVTNSGYNFTYYKDFEPKEYSADYIIYSGRNLKELEMDIEDFNNLEAKDFLRYKAPEFPWTKTTQETKMLESKKLKEDKNFVVVEILDPFEDGEARNIVASYGGQLDNSVWEVNKENVQDIKDELEDWENRVAFYSSYNRGKFGRKLKEARMRNSGREDQITPNTIEQETSIFFEDEGFIKIDHKTYPRPRTFRIFDDHNGKSLNINVAINGDYEDDILINTFFDSRCGYGYVIQTQTLEGCVEWAGFDKSEFKEDLEDAWVSAKKFFEVNKDKHTLETWLNREVGQSISQDEIHDIIEKAYQQDPKSYFTKLLSQEEFDAYLNQLIK